MHHDQGRELCLGTKGKKDSGQGQGEKPDNGQDPGNGGAGGGGGGGGGGAATDETPAPAPEAAEQMGDKGGAPADTPKKVHPAPVDPSSPDMTAQDYKKCGIKMSTGQKEFVGKGCLVGHESTALSESNSPKYIATCEGKSGIPLCGPVASRGEQFECYCYR